MMAGVQAKLVSVTSGGSFYDLVGGRIYRTEAPPDTAEALAIVTVVADPPVRYFGPSDNINAVIQIDIYGAKGVSETTTQAISTALVTLVDGAALTISGYNGASAYCIDRGLPTIEDQRVRIITQWRIVANKT